jgi:propionate CoA-transferase
LAAKPHVTAGAGGFVDITARAKRIVFSGYFTAGAKLGVEGGRLQIMAEGKVKKLVPEVEHVSFSGRRAVEQGQEVTYVTERCVMRLTPDGITVTELAPGVDLERDVLAMAAVPLQVSPELRAMDERLFRPEPIGLELPEA